MGLCRDLSAAGRKGKGKERLHPTVEGGSAHVFLHPTVTHALLVSAPLVAVSALLLMLTARAQFLSCFNIDPRAVLLFMWRGGIARIARGCHFCDPCAWGVLLFSRRSSVAAFWALLTVVGTFLHLKHLRLLLHVIFFLGAPWLHSSCERLRGKEQAVSQIDQTHEIR